jgi:hypothetical protein
MNEMKTGKLILFCWIALGLKTLPHVLLSLHFMNLPSESSYANCKLVWQEVARCWCVLMPLHQWTLLLVLLMGYKVIEHWRARGRGLHILKGTIVGLPLLLALGLAVYEFGTFSSVVDGMKSWKPRTSSAEFLRDLDDGETEIPQQFPGTYSSNAANGVTGNAQEKRSLR